MIQVGIVEDQLLFREGIKAILATQPDMQLIFESPDGYSVLERLTTSAIVPDVLLVDLVLSHVGQKEFNGMQVTRAVLEAYPEIRILILSVHNDENFIAQLIEHGAHGYLVKDCDPGELYNAIRAVRYHGSYINPRTLKALQNNLLRKQKAKQIGTHDAQLTRREAEILELICQQFTTDEIAEKLFISPKTVDGHRINLLQKTGSRNTAGLVVYAVKNNLVRIL
jgi:DNA-binding NarL/FixJ family response regulator